MTNIILFDGLCNFCSRSVQFIIKRDSEGVFQFASLQSKIGQSLLKEYHINENVDSIVYISDGKVYIKSSAALHVCRKLSGLWTTLFAFYLVPRPLRDVLYDIIAANRYKWFGKNESCMFPTPDIKRRFLE